MSNAKRPSEFVWYELHTPDAKAAAEFYSKALGWAIEDAKMPDKTYLIALTGERMVGGLLEKPKAEFGAGAEMKTPMWIGYVGVENVDESAKSIVDGGGRLHKGPENIPGVGRFAVMADAQGAIFCVFQPTAGQPNRPTPANGLAGTFGWSELSAVDWEAVWPLYAKEFGWTESQAMDRKEMGLYQMFNAEDLMLGAMMNRANKLQAPAWLYYVNVDDADLTAARIKDAGGQVVHGPVAVPTGERVAVCVDVQGGPFGIVARRK